MRIFFIAAMAFLFVVSCNSTGNAPEFMTFKTVSKGGIAPDNEEDFTNENYAAALSGKSPVLDSLLSMQHLYFTVKEKFDVDRYRNFWDEFRTETLNRELTQEEVLAWFDITGFLFQLTAEASVAEELERMVWHYYDNNNEIIPDSLFLPYVITRHTDNVHVNLFVPASVEFDHSLGGHVTITQETGFPDSGRTSILFGMETKQYIELFIRIPSWVDHAEVSVKGVKYLVHPGSYTKVAKKWKEGDVAEVFFSTNNLPGYIIPSGTIN